MQWRPQKFDYALSEDSAKEQVQELLDFYEINPAEIARTEVQENLEDSLVKLVGYYRRGIFENKREEGTLCVVFHPQRGKGDLTFREITGRETVVLSKYSDQAHRGVYAVMARLAGIGEEDLQDLHSVDASAMEALAVVFLSR